MAKKRPERGFKKDKSLIVNLSPDKQNTLGTLSMKALRKALEVVGAPSTIIGQIIANAIPRNELLEVKTLNRHFLTLWREFLDPDRLKEDPITHASEILRTIIEEIISKIGQFPSGTFVEGRKTDCKDESVDTGEADIMPVSSKTKKGSTITPEISPAVKDYHSDYENEVFPSSSLIPPSVLKRFKTLREEADRKLQEQEIMEEATV